MTQQAFAPAAAQAPAPVAAAPAPVAPAPVAVRPWRGMTRQQYDALVGTGALEAEHVELIEGDIVEVAPQGEDHARTIRHLTRKLGREAPDPWFLGVQLPLAVSGSSEPEPDLCLTELPASGHPTTAALVIEVAVTSQALDLQVKPAIYAAAGVTEYWVVDVPAREVVVHTEPGPTGYRLVRRQAWSEPLTAPVGDGVVVDLASLLGR